MNVTTLAFGFTREYFWWQRQAPSHSLNQTGITEIRAEQKLSNIFLYFYIWHNRTEPELYLLRTERISKYIQTLIIYAYNITKYMYIIFKNLSEIYNFFFLNIKIYSNYPKLFKNIITFIWNIQNNLNDPYDTNYLIFYPKYPKCYLNYPK